MMSTRSIFPQLLFAATVVGAGSQIAVNALSFLQGTFGGPEGDLPAIAGAVFAPFALIALVLPLAAVPLATRLFPRPPAPGVLAIPTALLIWLLAETGIALARSTAGLAPLGSPFLLHVLMFGHGCAAGFLMSRS